MEQKQCVMLSNSALCVIVAWVIWRWTRPEKQKPLTKIQSIFPWKKKSLWKVATVILKKLISASAIGKEQEKRENKDGIPSNRSMGEHLGLGFVCPCVHMFWLWILCISPKELEGMPSNYQQRIPDCFWIKSWLSVSLGFTKTPTVQPPSWLALGSNYWIY